jgi:outer membrane immunogenic protein
MRMRGIQMKKLLISAAVLLTAGSAFAADMPVKGRGPAPAPAMVAPSWTGCNIFGGGGYGMYNIDAQVIDNVTGAAVQPERTPGGRGWFGTIGAGCDYQFAGRWVVGIFGDYDFSSIKGDYSFFNTVATVAGERKLDDSWAIGGRIGYLVTPQLLSYFAGGYSEAHFTDTSLFTVGGVLANQVRGQTHSGYFLGGGVEYNIGWLPGLFWKTEYRLADYGRERLPILNAAGVATAFSDDHRAYVQTVRSALVWRWNWR